MNNDDEKLFYITTLLHLLDESKWDEGVWPIFEGINESFVKRLSPAKLKKKFDKLKNFARKNQHSKTDSTPGEPVHISRLLKESRLESKWIVDKLIPEGGISIISGNPASFKTWVVLHMAASIANGVSVFGEFNTRKSSVLIVNEEDSRNMLRDRLDQMLVNKDSQMYFSIATGFKMDDQIQLDKLVKFIMKKRIKVLFFDSLVRMHSGNENESRDIASVFEKLKSLTSKGITVIVTHHHRKALPGTYDKQPLRGSSDILAAVDCHLVVEKKDDATLRISQPKIRITREIESFFVNVHIVDQNLNLIFKEYDTPQPENSKSKKEVAKELVLEELIKNSPMARPGLVSVIKDQGVGENAVGDALHELEAEGKISVVTGDKGKKVFSIIPSV